jgi:hypothetical protein
MIEASQKAARSGVKQHGLGTSELEALREKINNEEYIYEAIQRIALILSNELLDIPHGGLNYEQQRRRR